MNEKVLLILADGMRSDSVAACGHPFAEEFRKKCSYTYNAQTVSPSVTLPCHMSLVCSVDPSRHGILTNIWAPQVRPIDGIFECVRSAGKTTALYYSWGPLRNIAQVSSVSLSYCFSSDADERYGDERWRRANEKAVENAIRMLQEEEPDFMFLYLSSPDEQGHRVGWMTPEYLEAVHDCWRFTEQVLHSLPQGYTTILTADHGGHERMHGTEEKEDMTIPLFLHGPRFTPEKELFDVSIKDIAPTIAELLGVKGDPAWEGKSLL